MSHFFQKKLGWLFFACIFLTGCAKSDNDPSGDTGLSPTYSLPVGNIEVVFEDIVKLYQHDLLEIPENYSSDTIASFYYNDKMFLCPHRFDTTVIKAFDFENLTTDLDKITALIFRTNIDNGIPSHCTMQLYFMNSDLTVLDSLFHDKPLAIQGAPTNDDGLPLGTYQLRKKDTPLNQDQINLIKNVDVIGLKFSLDINDFSETNTNYQPNQKIWIQFGVTVTLGLSM